MDVEEKQRSSRAPDIYTAGRSRASASRLLLMGINKGPRPCTNEDKRVASVYNPAARRFRLFPSLPPTATSRPPATSPIPTHIAMAPKPASTAGKAPASTASKAPAKAEKAAKKTASKSAPSGGADGEKKKRKKTRKETYSSYIYKGEWRWQR